MHKICVWTQIRKIKRKSLMRDSDWLKINFHLSFLICIQTQILCNGVWISYIYYMYFIFFTFRDFLRLGVPLNCRLPREECEDLDPSDETSPTKSADSHMSTSVSPQTPNNSNGVTNCSNLTKVQGQEVPLTRVKCLVSMTTPRDVRLATNSLMPAFVEFDMSAEGFGCLYLPSIAPQVSPAQSVVSVGMASGNDGTITTGIGSGECLVLCVEILILCLQVILLLKQSMRHWEVICEKEFPLSSADHLQTKLQLL